MLGRFLRQSGASHCNLKNSLPTKLRIGDGLNRTTTLETSEGASVALRQFAFGAGEPLRGVGTCQTKHTLFTVPPFMPPPQPGFFSYADDVYSLDTIHSGQNLSRRRPRASASSSTQQHQPFQLSAQQRSGHQLLAQHQGGGPSSVMDSGGMDHHSLDRSVNARIIRGNGGNGRGLGNGIGGIGSIASGSRNPPRQQERELSPDNSATHNNVKRKREAQDRLLKYAKDRYEKRDEYVAFISVKIITFH